jgi:hypothetical protein
VQEESILDTMAKSKKPSKRTVTTRLTPAAPDTPPIHHDATAIDTPQAVQATAQAVAQELDRILVDTVAEIFNMEQVETTAAVTRASRSTSPANEPLATQPSPRNDEEAAVEAAAEMEEYRDCQEDPVLPPIERCEVRGAGSVGQAWATLIIKVQKYMSMVKNLPTSNPSLDESSHNYLCCLSIKVAGYQWRAAPPPLYFLHVVQSAAWFDAINKLMTGVQFLLMRLARQIFDLQL